MAPSIRVDEEVYGLLKKQAEPFVDSPNSVLRRILQLDIGEATSTEEVAKRAGRKRPSRTPVRRGARRTRGTGRTRVPAGVLLPEDEYVSPLLAALAERGGEGAAGEIIEAVGEKLRDALTEMDKETLASGLVRWKNRVQFVRLRLVQEGLMVKDSPRGVWRLTPEGQARVSNLRSLAGTGGLSG